MYEQAQAAQGAVRQQDRTWAQNGQAQQVQALQMMM